MLACVCRRGCKERGRNGEIHLANTGPAFIGRALKKRFISRNVQEAKEN